MGDVIDMRNHLIKKINEEKKQYEKNKKMPPRFIEENMQTKDHSVEIIENYQEIRKYLYELQKKILQRETIENWAFCSIRELFWHKISDLRHYIESACHQYGIAFDSQAVTFDTWKTNGDFVVFVIQQLFYKKKGGE